MYLTSHTAHSHTDRLLLANTLVIIDHDLPCFWWHEALGRSFSSPRQSSHLRSTNEHEIIFAFRIVEVHRFLELVVCCDAEWYNLKLRESGRHGQHLSTDSYQVLTICCNYELLPLHALSLDNVCIRVAKLHVCILLRCRGHVPYLFSFRRLLQPPTLAVSTRDCLEPYEGVKLSIPTCSAASLVYRGKHADILSQTRQAGCQIILELVACQAQTTPLYYMKSQPHNVVLD